MPKIRFLKNRPDIEVPDGANLMQALNKSQIPVASSCHGDGVCARCRIVIVEGMTHLSPVNQAEEMLRDRLKISRDVRISCQTQVLGDIVIDTSYW